MNIKGLFEVAVKVKDLERSSEFYTNILRFEAGLQDSVRRWNFLWVMLNRIVLLAIATLVSACGTSPLVTPHPMYSAGLAPSESSIFVSADQRTNEPVLSTLVAVDDRQVDCDWNAGCPVWTRVTAQSHEFTIRYRADFYGVPGVTNSSHGEAMLKVKVSEMKARHVYVARYTRDLAKNAVFVQVEDLGENPKFALRFPLFGTPNPRYYPAEF